MMDENGKMQPRVTLRIIAERVGLTAGTISAVLNNTRAADRIPQRTRERVIAAARELNYSPNPLARALRCGKSTNQRHETEGKRALSGALVILGSEQFGRALRAIQQAGLRVPDDVSVVDLFDIPLWKRPSVVTAENPGYEIAKLS